MAGFFIEIQLNIFNIYMSSSGALSKVALCISSLPFILLISLKQGLKFSQGFIKDNFNINNCILFLNVNPHYGKFEEIADYLYQDFSFRY